MILTTAPFCFPALLTSHRWQKEAVCLLTSVVAPTGVWGWHWKLCHTQGLGLGHKKKPEASSTQGVLGHRSLRKLLRGEGFFLSFCDRQICLYLIKQASSLL